MVTLHDHPKQEDGKSAKLHGMKNVSLLEKANCSPWCEHLFTSKENMKVMGVVVGGGERKPMRRHEEDGCDKINEERCLKY